MAVTLSTVWVMYQIPEKNLKKTYFWTGVASTWTTWRTAEGCWPGTFLFLRVLELELQDLLELLELLELELVLETELDLSLFLLFLDFFFFFFFFFFSVPGRDSLPT